MGIPSSAGGHRPSGSSRSYIQRAIKVASHPVRTEILDFLRKGPRSTTELETDIGRSRYDIYHHLEVLCDAGLIEEIQGDARLKRYRLLEPDRPQAAVSILDKDRIKKHKAAFKRLIDCLEELEERPIPHRSLIDKAQVVLTYPWTTIE